MKKTKNVPAIVMLLGCAVAAIVSYINKYSLEKMLKIVLVALVIFLFIGLVIKYLFEKYIPPIEEEEEITDDEGSVIEKTPEDEMEADALSDGEGVTQINAEGEL